ISMSSGTGNCSCGSMNPIRPFCSPSPPEEVRDCEVFILAPFAEEQRQLAHNRTVPIPQPLRLASPCPSCKSSGQSEGRSMRISRREILALSACGVVFASRPPALAAPEQLRTVRVGKAIISSFPFAGIELGVKQGIWKSVGLTVEISVFRGDGQLQQALAAGSVDF